MKKQELRALGEADVDRQLEELRQELFNLRFQFATRRLTNTARIREVRKDIARLLTRQRQLELHAARG
ncbi:MAG TPA: 50S ribosomal protein L29 [Beijerinckiaceae bacterium]|jgi:large subunit ribosomal protein L29|nr:50S ribosomal protein L29 [Beijerinckiaceae bacterium]